MKNYKFQCECCGATNEGDEITQTCLGVNHEEGCDEKLGMPVHYIPLYDWKHPNKPKV